MKWLELRKKEKVYFNLNQNFDIFKKERHREREREREREISSHRTLKQTIALQATNVTCAANNTELIKSAATGQRLTGGSPVVWSELTASKQQA